MQDGICEDDEGMQKVADQIPSFKRKTTLDPATHSTFFVPTGEQGEKLVDAIIEAIGESGAFY